MGKRVFLAAVLVFLTGMAFAEHAISLEPEAAPAVAPKPALTPETPSLSAPPAPEAVAAAQAAAQPVQPAPRVDVTFPPELDVYVVPAATREVCTTLTWGYDEVRTDCRITPVPVRREDPALRGVCVTRYGQRTCH